MSHALEQVKAARIRVICKSASIAPHFLLARLQRYSFQFVFQVFPAYTLQLPSICVLRTAFEPFCWNNLGILTGSSWHFSDISSDIPASWAHGSTSLDVDKANGMLTSNAKSIFSDNVTCFARSKHVSQIRDICKSASIAPHFLLARLQRYSFQFVFQVFSTYTLQLPSIRVLPTAFKNLSSEAHEYRASCSAC